MYINLSYIDFPNYYVSIIKLMLVKIRRKKQKN